jgi:dihydrofolate synthase/folylpolyglutamate synthase
MTYDETRRWWFSRVDYERKAPQPGDLKLDRMRELLHRLGDPHTRFRSIHVAGSKGKGSTCAMLESVLRHAGFSTGLFTSPHLTDVRERIQVNNLPITPEELVAVAQVVRPVVESLEFEGQSPTFFEVTTALGFSALRLAERRNCHRRSWPWWAVRRHQRAHAARLGHYQHQSRSHCHPRRNSREDRF